MELEAFNEYRKYGGNIEKIMDRLVDKYYKAYGPNVGEALESPETSYSVQAKGFAQLPALDDVLSKGQPCYAMKAQGQYPPSNTPQQKKKFLQKPRRRNMKPIVRIQTGKLVVYPKMEKKNGQWQIKDASSWKKATTSIQPLSTPSEKDEKS
jgi:hypothetical protein